MAAGMIAARAQRSRWRQVIAGIALVSIVAACSSGSSVTASPSAAASSSEAASPSAAASSSEAASPSAAASSSEAASPSAAAFTPQRKNGIPGALLPSDLKLWTYDFATAKYVVAPGDASAAYVPNDRAAPKPYTIAYEEGWAANSFSVSIHQGIYSWAKKMGVKIITCDAQFDPTIAVNCAEQLAQQKPDFVINSNWRTEAAAATMKIYDAAKIPAVTIDVVHPNAIFMGADNYVSGLTAGKAAGDYALNAGKCADVTLVLGGNPGEGDAANQRLAGFSDGVQLKCGQLPADHIATLLFDAGTPDQALTKTTDWLTANPGAKYILATSIDDERVSGMTKALSQSSRQGIGVGQGCDAVGISATKEGTVDSTHFLGCVAFFPEKYPDYVMSIALDVLAGKPVPQEVHIEHQFLTRNNITQFYP
jgi:ribose transport system substrate-binding protein